MASLGQICIVGAFGLALYSIVSSIVGVRLRARELVASGSHAAWAVTGLITAASITLLVALSVHDFSLRWFRTIASYPEFVHAFWVSLGLGALSSFVALLFAVPAALAIARYRFRQKRCR